MRILFTGAVYFSRHCLVEVLKNNGQVVGIITLAREYAHCHADYADLSGLAARHRIPLFSVKDINCPKTLSIMESLAPDIIFIFGWSQLISEKVLSIPAKGCLGTHPALLPKNRGRHPIIWALAEGLKESGLTFFYIEEGTDNGDILWQKPFEISLNDDAASVYQKIKDLASSAIQEFLPQLEADTAPRIPQDHIQASYWRKRSAKDGEINWAAPTIKSYNLIRALTRPYVGAHSFVGKDKVIIWRSKLPDNPSQLTSSGCEAGTVISRNKDSAQIKTGDGYLNILEYQIDTGRNLEIGTRLGVSS